MVENNLRIGIDIGGTKVLGILIDKDNKILKRIKIPTPQDKNEFYDKISNLVLELDSTKKARVGIGLPGSIMFDGMFTNCPNIVLLKNSYPKKEFENRIKREVKVENDSNCFAKSILFDYPDEKNVFGIIIGTGVGGGPIINGEIYKGANGMAGEIGHIKFFHDRIIEDYLGASFFKHKFGENLKLELNKKSDKVITTINEWHANLARLISIVIIFYNPSMISFGGGLTNILRLNLLKRNLKLLVPSEYYKTTTLIKNLNGDAGAIGAALL